MRGGPTLSKSSSWLDSTPQNSNNRQKKVVPNFQILKKFRELDLDRNGLLSLEEALKIAEQLSLPLSSESVRSIMSDVAGNGEGQITYYEYLGAIAHIGFQ
jgi:calmodulin